MKRAIPLILVLVTFCLAVSSDAHRGKTLSYVVAATPDQNGCSLTFGGSVQSRKAVKLRSPSLNYPLHNGGNPISVNEFLQFVCSLDSQVHFPVSKTQPMSMEKDKITIKAFVMAMKLDPDNDLHIQIADQAAPYDQKQIIVEIPPGAAYCTARSHMMDLFRADGGTSLSSHVFAHPPKVELTGYLFLDAFHGSASCTNSGGRGIQNGLGHSPVQGLWEVHPVIKLEPVH
jgi:hypothetical protein